MAAQVATLTGAAGTGTVSPTQRWTVPAGRSAGDWVIAAGLINATNTGVTLTHPATADTEGHTVTSLVAFAGTNNNSLMGAVLFQLTSTDITNGYVDFTWSASGRPSVVCAVIPAALLNSARQVVAGAIGTTLTPSGLTTLEAGVDVIAFAGGNVAGSITMTPPSNFSGAVQSSTTAGSGANMHLEAAIITTPVAAGSVTAASAFTAAGLTGPHSFMIALSIPQVLTGSNSIPSGEAFGSPTGSATNAGSPAGTLTGSNSIASGEAYGSPTGSTLTAISGSNSIASAQAFGTGALSQLDRTTLVVLGDSKTVQYGNGVTDITAALVARGWVSGNIQVYGVTGRLIWAGATHPTSSEDIDTMRAGGFEPYNWLIELGANNQGLTVASCMASWRSLLAYIGPGRRVQLFGNGYQDATECAVTYTGANPVGSRYSATNSAGYPNAAWLNIIDQGTDPATEPTIMGYYDWNASSLATASRVSPSTDWLTSDTSSPNGLPRHMSVHGYETYQDPAMALAADVFFPVATGVNSIVSAQAFGSPTGSVTPGALTATGSNSIASAQAFGSPTGSVTPGAVSTTGSNSIPSAEAYGSPTGAATPGAVSLTGSNSIASAQAFGTPTGSVTAGALAATGSNSIASAQAFGTPTGSLTTGPVSVTAGTSIASAENLPQGTVVSGSGTSVGSNSIGSSQAFGTPTGSVLAGPRTLTGTNSIGSAEVFGTGQVNAGPRSLTGTNSIFTGVAFGTGTVGFPVTGIGSYWNGTSLVPGDMHFWNGTSLVPIASIGVV